MNAQKAEDQYILMQDIKEIAFRERLLQFDTHIEKIFLQNVLTKRPKRILFLCRMFLRLNDGTFSMCSNDLCC